MGYTYAEAIRQTVINNMSQFSEDQNGSNIGVGYIGWDNAFRYMNSNDLDYMGAIFLFYGDSVRPDSFSSEDWDWTFIVRLFVRYDGMGAALATQRVGQMATDFITVMSDASNRRNIESTGYVKLRNAYGLSEPFTIEGVPFISMEFIITVREGFPA